MLKNLDFFLVENELSVFSLPTFNIEITHTRRKIYNSRGKFGIREKKRLG